MRCSYKVLMLVFLLTVYIICIPDLFLKTKAIIIILPRVFLA